MIDASSNTELIKKLSRSIIDVPPRHKGRKTEHTEKYCLYKMLSTLAKENCIGYPMKALKTERPDFVIIEKSVKRGLEHTEAVPANKAKKDYLRGKMNNNEAHVIDKHYPGEAQKLSSELEAEIENSNASAPWMGDSVEVNWAEAMAYFIHGKSISALKDGYALYDKNDLLIYDNWPAAMLDIEVGVRYLIKDLSDNAPTFQFDCINILTRGQLLRIENDVFQTYEINDVWENN